MKLSAVIITFNEESNIGRCIDSLIPVVDEIIIVDSYSTDKTTEIIKSKELTFFQLTWPGYSEAKNYGNSKTTGDFILSIDADEELSPMLQQSILDLKKGNSQHDDAYFINRITNYCGKWIHHCGWYPEYKIRIFKKEGIHWTGTVHEELNLDKKKNIQKLKGDLYHYSYPTIESHLKKTLLYTKLTAEGRYRSGKNYNLVWHGVFKPITIFFKKFILQRGFLDGYYGFLISVITSFSHFLRYAHFRSMKKRI